MKYFIFLMISISLIGCQNVPPSINVFQLSQGPQSAVVNFDATQLLVERIELVDYLKQNNIIFEHNYGELTATKYQLWAEPINKGIARTLVNNINAEQNVIRADSSEFTTCRIKTACYRVICIQYLPQQVFLFQFLQHHISVDFYGIHRTVYRDVLSLYIACT